MQTVNSNMSQSDMAYFVGYADGYNGKDVERAMGKLYASGYMDGAGDKLHDVLPMADWTAKELIKYGEGTLMRVIKPRGETASMSLYVLAGKDNAGWVCRNSIGKPAWHHFRTGVPSGAI